MKKVIYYILIGIIIIIALIVFAANLTEQASKTGEQKGFANLHNINKNDTGFDESSLPSADGKKPIDNNISGRWGWEKNSEVYTFSVNIIKVDNHYMGTYFAVAESGMKIDGDVEDTPSFKIEDFDNNETVVDFETYFSGTVGKVKLRLENAKLYWEIVEEPKGEHYCPKVAVLIRFTE